jgi:tRNA-dihydrouridine synthase 2
MATTGSSMTLEAKARALFHGEALAPMVRASTTPLRVLALKYGADFVYTEELIDRSITETIRVPNETLGTIDYVKDTSRLSQKVQKRLGKDGRPAVLLRIDPKFERGKLVCQIGTGEPELALAAALHVHRDVDAIDINMGCPKKFSISGGMGSALLSDPDRACRIIRTLTENLSHLGLPVSAKIRLLKDTASTVEFITGLISAGAKAVAIHGRHVGDDSTQPAHWEKLKEVVAFTKAKFPQVPILLNGDFYTREEFTNFQEETGASAVLLARPALYNTSLFRKPVTAVGGVLLDDSFGYESRLLLDKTTVVQDYVRESIRYDIHYKNVKYVVCEMMTNRRAPTPRVPFLPQTFARGQSIGTTCACHSLPEICKVWNVDCTTKPVKLRNEHCQQAPSGEHRYEDSYFLSETEVRSSDNETTEEPSAKRIRVDSS